MFSIRGDPPTGREEDNVARKMCWKDQMACAQILGAWDPPLECCIASTMNRNVKAHQRDLSIVFR
jgi:hypothetical protein